jgi:hypothetical protein
MPESSITRKPENELRAKLLLKAAQDSQTALERPPSVIQHKAVQSPVKLEMKTLDNSMMQS